MTVNSKRVTVTIEVEAVSDAEAYLAFVEYLESNNVYYDVEDLPDLDNKRCAWSGNA